jgi:1-aminocyclopropane-1-carboxylate deaminase/D-cysteine desulfhydrase-like pyridoxal-dependent ACC family enzyme
MEVIPRSRWPQVENMAKERCELLKAQGHKVFCVREGGAQLEALWGALTLALDIVQQEKELGLTFAQIWVDAGTGLTAQALILGLGLLKRQVSCEVLLCAGTEDAFKRDLAGRRAELAAELHCDIPLAAFRCHRPLAARSFGSTNQAVFQEIQRTAQESGIWLDPIYSAKLFMSARAAYAERQPEEPVLILHAGGVSSLFGFPDELAALGRSSPPLTS